MNAGAAGSGNRRWFVWAFVGAGLVLFVGANAHLVYVAVTTQPDCVAHSKVAAGEHTYRAAKSVC